jgi:hypothetical protein
MKKIYITGLALLAVVAFSAVATASAFAENPEWLIKGAAIAAGVKDSTEAAGSLTLSDLEVPIIGTAAVKCEGFFDGTVSSGGKGEITKVLNTSKEEVGEKLTGTALLCSEITNCEGTSSAWPIGLPYASQLELEGTKVIRNMTSPTIHTTGYEIECKAFGVTETDECTESLWLAEMINMLEGGLSNDLLEVIKEVRKHHCTLSGGESGDMEGEILIDAAEELSVSGDGVMD